MPALLVFLGLSSCATLFIVAAVALNARGTRSSEVGSCETIETATSVKSPSIVPAFSH